MKDNIKKCLYKIRYITEFICVLIFVFFLVKTIYTKAYYGYFHKLYLLCSIICFAILLINIIYNFKKSNKKIEKIFLSIAIPLGLLYLSFMIPGHVPDETTHFYKAYDISKGNLTINIDENGQSYIEVPKDLSLYNHTQITNYKEFVEIGERKTDYSDTEKVISTAQGNSFIMYIFSAVAFFIARVLNINIVYGILLGRLFNFIFFLILSYLGIKKISIGKLVYGIYLLMPMNLQQVTSNSPDAIINSVVLYYIAYSVYMIFKKEKLTKKEIITYVISTAIVGILKMVYILIAGVGFLLVKRNDIKLKNKILIIACTILIGGIATIGTYISSTMYTSVPETTTNYNEEFNVDSQKQIEKIKEEPAHVVRAFIYDWYNMQKDYMFMAIGSQLGWLEIKPPETIIVLYLILLIISVFAEKNEEDFNWKEKIWLLLIFIGVTFLVEIAMYTSFTPVGAEFVGGIQGRYYIPIYIIILLCLIKKHNHIKFNSPEKNFLIASSVLNIFIIIEILKYFV